MMRILSLCLLLSSISFAQNQPKLIVAIVIDQMRYEMLNRFKEDFGPNGFNRLVGEGLQYDSCYIDYVPTYTGPGHATIFTGSVPSEHGILSNDIYDPTLNRSYYCVSDESVKLLGTDKEESGVSSKNMRNTGFGDALKVQNSNSKVIAMALKDRGAILSGGLKPDAAYWMADNGNMVSSTYYVQALPNWVEAFNQNDMVGDFMAGSWELLNDTETYNESLPDNASFESTRLGTPPTLPYNLTELLEKENKKAIAYTPFGNTILTEFAFDAIDSEKLGEDEVTDLLALIYSATDYIGHDFGPRSVEIQDTYLRLDLEIERLIDKLDTEIGRSNYVIFLSSDHGVAETPSDTSFSYVKNSDLEKQVNTFSKATYGIELVEHIGYSQIWLDDDVIEEEDLEREEITEALSNYLLHQSIIAFEEVFTKAQIVNCTSGRGLLFKNAFDPELSGDIFYIRPYGHIERGASYGSTHSTSHEYDAHVPLVFFGANVNPGTNPSKIGTHQIIAELQKYLK